MTVEEAIALARAVLESRDWTERVVAAAVMAHDTLSQGPVTADGDASYVTAGSLLRIALADHERFTDRAEEPAEPGLVPMFDPKYDPVDEEDS